ncbi:hypothetical protein V3C99_008304 [Haemonchus contortus]|uniref:Leucine-rich repeat-containing protein DDB_G0290503 n=1 Tax=Haemonchus contortus TaxID=6289 RepID=A0A7I4YNY7_HAECO
MGTSASAHRTAVKSISIDQNGWNRSCSSERGSSATSRRSLPVLSNWINHRSSRCDGGLTKAERLQLVDRAMRAEATALECEGKVKGLEREIRTLELRNHDLSTEVCWLRQQCTTACPDVPNGSVASFVPPNCSEQCQVEKKVLQNTVTEQNGELSSLRSELDRMQSVDMRKDIRISELIKELEATKCRVEALEELCRNHMSGVRPLQQNAEVNVLANAERSEEGSVRQDDIANGSLNDHIKPTRTTKDVNLRLLKSLPQRPEQNVSSTSRDNGKAVDSKTEPLTSPPLAGSDTVSLLRSIQVLKEIPRGNQNVNESPSDRPYESSIHSEKKSLAEDTENEDSDLDIADILNDSTRSAWSTRTQSSKSRDSGICRESFTYKACT